MTTQDEFRNVSVTVTVTAKCAWSKWAWSTRYGVSQPGAVAER